MLVLDQDEFTIIVLDLSAQTKFGAKRSIDGNTYTLTLYNTILDKGFDKQIESDAANGLEVDGATNDLILTFNLMPNARVTEIAYTNERSTKLAIKLYIRHRKRR